MFSKVFSFRLNWPVGWEKQKPNPINGFLQTAPFLWARIRHQRMLQPEARPKKFEFPSPIRLNEVVGQCHKTGSKGWSFWTSSKVRKSSEAENPFFHRRFPIWSHSPVGKAKAKTTGLKKTAPLESELESDSKECTHPRSIYFWCQSPFRNQLEDKKPTFLPPDRDERKPTKCPFS